VAYHGMDVSNFNPGEIHKVAPPGTNFCVEAIREASGIVTERRVDKASTATRWLASGHTVINGCETGDKGLFGMGQF